MVNNYMKELSALGWLEYHRKSSKNVSYPLTSAGQQQIEAVEAELVQEMVHQFAASKSRIRERVLSQVSGTLHRVVLVGSGDLAEMAFHAFESAQISVVGICDYEAPNVGRDWCGRKVLDLAQVLYLKPDAVVIADTLHPGDIVEHLRYLSDYGIHVICLGARAAGKNGNGSIHLLAVTGDPADLVSVLKSGH
jgi:hypothetical protein